MDTYMYMQCNTKNIHRGGQWCTMQLKFNPVYRLNHWQFCSCSTKKNTECNLKSIRKEYSRISLQPASNLHKNSNTNLESESALENVTWWSIGKTFAQ